jgi:hypothetical protein
MFYLVIFLLVSNVFGLLSSFSHTCISLSFFFVSSLTWDLLIMITSYSAMTKR